MMITRFAITTAWVVPGCTPIGVACPAGAPIPLTSPSPATSATPIPKTRLLITLVVEMLRLAGFHHPHRHPRLPRRPRHHPVNLRVLPVLQPRLDRQLHHPPRHVGEVER